MNPQGLCLIALIAGPEKPRSMGAFDLEIGPFAELFLLAVATKQFSHATKPLSVLMQNC
jgi:hypothetical protein